MPSIRQRIENVQCRRWAEPATGWKEAHPWCLTLRSKSEVLYIVVMSLYDCYVEGGQRHVVWMEEVACHRLRQARADSTAGCVTTHVTWLLTYAIIRPAYQQHRSKSVSNSAAHNQMWVQLRGFLYLSVSNSYALTLLFFYSIADVFFSSFVDFHSHHERAGVGHISVLISDHS